MTDDVPTPPEEDTAAERPAEQRRKAKFGLQPWAGVAWIIFAATVVWFDWRVIADAETSEGTGEAIGGMLGAAAFYPLVCMGIVWLVCWVPFKSRTAASIVFVLLLGLGGLGQWGQHIRRQQVQVEEALQQFRDELREMSRANLAAMEAGNPPTLRSTIERIEKAYRRAGNQFEGSFRTMMHTVADAYSGLSERAGAYDKAWDAVAQTGGINVSTISTKQEIAPRIEAFREGRARSGDWIDALEALPEKLEHRIRATDISEEMQRGFIKSFQQDLTRLTRMQQSFEYDRKIATEAISLLQMLRDNWDRWTYDSAAQQFIFDTQTLIDRYNKKTEKINRLAREQVRLRRQLMNTGGSEPAQ